MNPFYNRSQRRLRAFWRLLIQFTVNFLGLGVLNLLAILAIAALLMLAGQIPFDLVNQGHALQRALQEAFAENPLLNALPRLMLIPLLLGVYWLLARLLDRRPFRDYGFHLNASWWRDLVFGMALGAVLIALIFLVELALGWVSVTGTRVSPRGNVPFWVGITVALVNFTFVSISEELLARGYMIRNMAEGFNLPRVTPKQALLAAFFLSSAIFGLLHLGNPNSTWVSTVNLILAGLLLGLGFVLTGQLAIPLGLHLTWNFFMGNVFGFPVSGVGDRFSFIGIEQAGPEAFTGGAFGPEGGLIGVGAMLLGIALTYAWVRWTSGRAALQSELAVYSFSEIEQERVAAVDET